MPLKLDKTDLAILESLVTDGRKSFRQISREINVSAPTVKLHYNRLVDTGLIRGVSIDLDLGRLEEAGSKLGKVLRKAPKKQGKKLAKEMHVSITCDYCKGPTHNKPSILKVGKQERFFCCHSCRTLYREKYGSRIESLSKK